MAKGRLKIDSKEWNLDFFTSRTEEEVLKILSTTEFSANRIKKVWKIANGKTVPNYLKEQLKSEEPTKKIPKAKKKK